MFLLRSLAVVEQGSEEGAARERSVKFDSEGPLEPAWGGERGEREGEIGLNGFFVLCPFALFCF